MQLIERARELLRDSIVARGSVATFAVQIADSAIHFGLYILLARLMGVRHYGIYAFVLACLTVSVTLSKMGWDTTLVRFVSSYVTNEQFGRLRGILRGADRYVLSLSLALGSVAALAVFLVRGRLEPALFHSLLIGCATLPVFALLWVRQGAIQGLKHPVKSLLPRRIILPLLLGAAVLALERGGWIEATAPTVLIVQLGATVTALLVAAWWLKTHLPAPVGSAEPVDRSREWRAVATALLFTSGLWLVINRTDTIMVGALVGAEAAGIYDTASRVGTVVEYGLTASSVIIAPVIAELYSDDDHSGLQRSVTLVAWGIFLYSVPVALLLILLGSWILGFWGTAFTAGYGALVILVLGRVASGLCGPVVYLLTMTEHERHAAWIFGFSAVLNVVANVIFIALLGMEGAAIATTLTLVLWKGTMLVSVYRRLSINPTIFGRLPRLRDLGLG